MSLTFNFDWFSGNIPTLERTLGSFAGKPVSALEIGTHEGRSATWLLSNVLTHPQARLLCVDLFEQPVLRANINAVSGTYKTTIRIGLSREVLHPVGPDTFDFAYIDGSHWSCDVLEDAVMVFRRTKVGGVIGFDDYLWDDPAFNQHGTPKLAIDAFLVCYAHKLEVLQHDYQVWVRKTAP
jgi:predicted O-methyltransferase YrrM